MGSSARVGTDPVTLDDSLIARYFLGRFVFHDTRLTDIDMSLGGAVFSLMFPPGTTDGKPSPPETRLVMVAALCLGIIVAVSTIARLVIRLYIRRGIESKRRLLTLDDWTIIPATLVVLLNQSWIYVSAEPAGYGQHLWFLSYAQLRTAYERAFLSFTTFMFASALIKISIVCFLRRVVGNSIPVFYMFTTIFPVILILYAIVGTCSWAFMCGNPRYQADMAWTAQQPIKLRCLNLDKLNTITTAVHIMLDFILFIVAAYLYYRIKSTWTRKISLLTLFSLGAASCTFGILRVWQQSLVVQSDSTYASGRILLYAMLDESLALLIANLPAVYAFIYELNSEWRKDRMRRAEHEARRKRSAWYRSIYGKDDIGVDSTTLTNLDPILPKSVERSPIVSHAGLSVSNSLKGQQRGPLPKQPYNFSFPGRSQRYSDETIEYHAETRDDGREIVLVPSSKNWDWS